jgi:hypothetical protein
MDVFKEKPPAVQLLLFEDTTFARRQFGGLADRAAQIKFLTVCVFSGQAEEPHRVASSMSKATVHD